MGITIFLLAFIPLIFGGTIYRMLEKVMTLKLILILTYLTFVAVFLVSPHNMWEVITGFVGFGTYAERAETILVDPHFNFTLVDNADRLLVKGTVENGGIMIGQYQINGVTQSNDLSADEKARRDGIVAKAVAHMRPGEFFVETQPEEGAVLSMSGRVENGTWVAERFSVTDAKGVHHYDRLEDVPPQYAPRLANLLENQGLEKRNLVKYVADHGRLPDIDWFMLAAFTAIAGAGGLSNSTFSNYTREKGWGMGAARRRDSQRCGGTHDQAVARGQRVSDQFRQYAALARLAAAHLARSDMHLDAGLFRRDGFPAWYRWNSFATPPWRAIAWRR